MSLAEVFLLLASIGLGWFWLNSLNARDIAIAAAKRACSADGLQFLDESISGQRVRFTRDEDGQLTLGRLYRFEFSDTGDNRRQGTIILIGRRVELINTGPRLVH